MEHNQEQQESKEMQELMEKNIQKARAFVKRMNSRKPPPRGLTPEQKAEALNKLVHKWLEKQILHCPKCGKSQLEWSCCHEKF